MKYLNSKVELGVEKALEAEEYEEIKVPVLGIRHIQVALLFYAYFNVYSVKTFMSVAVVAMTDNTTSPNPDVPTYNWNNNSVILSSLLWGYIVFQIYAGHVAKNYGPKWFLFGSILVPGIICFIIPICAANFGSNGVIVCRVIQGLFLGFAFPSSQCTMGYWIPAQERSRLGSIINAGTSIGTIFGGISTGYISGSWLGWPWTFYLNGCICFIWCILWAFFGSNAADEHPRISDAEKKYIMASLGHQEGADVLDTPWKAILTSMPVCALTIAGIGNVWMVNTFITENPTYMTQVLGVSIETTSLLSSIYSAAAPIAGISSAVIADRLINKQILSTTAVRRLFHLLGTLAPAALCCSIGFIPKEEVAISVTVISLANILMAFCLNSTSVNYIDLSPKFSGIILGIVNATSQGVSIFAPLLVQFTVKDETDICQWRVIFIIAGGLLAATSIFYATFVSGERQWWNEGANENKDTEKN